MDTTELSEQIENLMPLGSEIVITISKDKKGNIDTHYCIDGKAQKTDSLHWACQGIIKTLE